MEGYCWVTVVLPKEMCCHSHSDDEIVSFMIYAIIAGNVIIGDHALHSLGVRCVSLRVKGIHQKYKRMVRAYAETFGVWWLMQFRIDRVGLDKSSIFDARVPSPAHINSLWNVPHGFWPIQ